MDTLDAINCLKKKKWVDLSHEIHKDIPYFSSFQPLKETTITTLEKDGFFAKEYAFATQYSTHIDAPIHFYEKGRFLDDIQLKELVLPLYVINKKAEVDKDNNYAVSIEDILELEQQVGKIESDSFVAFASGWSNRWNDPESYYNINVEGNAEVPGWSMDTLRFLAEERQIAAIGHETLDTDCGLDYVNNGSLAGEYYWLSQNKFQVEVMKNLTLLPPSGSAIVIGFPNVLHAPGFPCRAFAVLPE